MNHKFVFLVGVLAMLCALPLSARNYSNTPHIFTQPDSTEVEVRLFGNDLYIDAESSDGYTLVKDEDNGFICYAMLSSNGSEYASSGIVYRGGETPNEVRMIVSPKIRISAESIKNKQREAAEKLEMNNRESQPVLRSTSILPDTVYGVCLLIDFPDKKFTYTREQIDTYLNSEHGSIAGNARSIKEHFRWISSGKLTYINYLPAEIYTAPQSKSYYAPTDATEYTIDRFLPVVEDALASCTREKDGFDIHDLSVKDGALMAINIFYAGNCENKWATGLWPHKNAMQFKKIRDNRFFRNAWHNYQISDLGNDVKMSTFVHENQHMILGMPDFYSYDGHSDNNSEKYNIGDSFSLSQEKNPPYPNPFSLDELGWIDNKTVLNDINDGRMVHLKYGVGNVAVYYGSGKSASERYYLEIREIPGTWWSSAKKGIFIWHVNTKGDNTYEKNDYGMLNPELLDCRPATFDNPFWGESGAPKEFTDDSNPSAKWYNGDNSGIYLWDFSSPNLTEMTFRCGPYLLKDIVVENDSLPMGYVGENYSANLLISGGDGEYSVTVNNAEELPSWLNIDNMGNLSGVPDSEFEGSIEYEIKDNSNNRVEASLKLNVVSNDASSLANTSVCKIEVFPNPSKGSFNLYSREGGEAMIYTLSGVLVDVVTIGTEMASFGASLSRGVYILNFNGEVIKLVKR